jgi:hypothetical protein
MLEGNPLFLVDSLIDVAKSTSERRMFVGSGDARDK